MSSDFQPANDGTPAGRDYAALLADATGPELRVLLSVAAGVLAYRESIDHAETVLTNIGRALGEHREQTWLTLPQVVATVCAKYGVTTRDILGDTRQPACVRPRFEAYWLARQQRWADGRHRYSLPQIGKFFGHRDHTTIMHGIRKHERLILTGEQA